MSFDPHEAVDCIYRNAPDQYGDPRRDKIYQFAYAIKSKLKDKNERN